MEQQAETEVDFASMNDEELRQWLANKYPGRSVERDGDEIVVTIPVNFHRRNGRQIVQATGGETASSAENGVNETLVSALARAYQWQEELETGEFETIDQLANAKGVDRSYAGRILRLTSVSPQTVEWILNGDSADLSLRKLQNRISLKWNG